MGSEGSRALERQLQLYVAYFDNGAEQAAHGVFPRVMWLAPDERRVQVIEASVARLPAADRELFQVVRIDEVLATMLHSQT